MTADARALAIPVLLIAVGVGWLLSTMGFASEINWVWSLALAAVGVLTFVLYGLDKVTIVVGAIFVIMSAMSVLRQTGRLSLDVEVPLLVIALGVLMLVARHPRIPTPRWLKD
jgi:hypothetical protein